MGGMTGGESVEYRKIRTVKEIQNYLFQCISLIQMLGAIEHFSENNSVYSVQLSGVQHLRQHAINLVWLGIEVFDHQDGFVCLYLVCRTQCRYDQRQTATRQSSGPTAGAKDL